MGGAKPPFLEVLWLLGGQKLYVSWFWGLMVLVFLLSSFLKFFLNFLFDPDLIFGLIHVL